MISPTRRPLRAELKADLRRRLRNVAPGRRLRLQLGLAAIERHTAGCTSLRLLDAGSEEGLLCLELARRHPEWLLVAADISEDPLVRGRGWAQAEGLDVQYVRCDLTRSLGEAVYDVVVALESLVEIPDDRAAMAALVAALRPGGLFVLQVPTAQWTPVLPGAERTWRREARHGYDISELTAVLAGLGLEVSQVRPTFHRLVALGQDVRDRLKRRGRFTQLLLLPTMAAVVEVERRGLSWGPPRGWFVVATKR